MNRFYSLLIFISLFALSGLARADEVTDELNSIIKRWDEITFEIPENDREVAYNELLARARRLNAKHPGHAESLVWEGIILSTYAGAKGGLGALSVIRESRERLLEAERINPNAEDGSIYATLGSLHYQAPGWPISFGDDDKAREYLTKALKINPTDIDNNYFYGDFLIEEGEYEQAVKVLTHALEAPPRAGRELADKGRRKEIGEALKRAKSHIH